MLKPTLVVFPHGEIKISSQLLLYKTHLNSTYIVTEETPFHPISHIWPDHPADRGELIIDEQIFTVIDCVVGAIDQIGELFIGADIPVKREEAGWQFVVVHQIDALIELSPSQMVTLRVDKDYQDSLSRAHSGAHLAALALNKVLHQDYWRKQPDRNDELGHHHFHSYAEETSFVSPDRCIDTYRLGKTLRKRGLNSDDVVNNLTAIEVLVNQQLASWVETQAEIKMVCKGQYLTDSRYWTINLDAIEICMPCGGTHINSLAQLISLTVRLELDQAGQIIMTTQTKAA